MSTKTLRDGSCTEDVRLDRVVRFDERSRAYPVTATIRTTVKRSYTWTAGPVTDQGSEGACVGHGWTGELTARPQAVKITSTDPTSYAYALYHTIQHRDPWQGCSLGSKCPTLPTPDQDNYDGTAVIDGAKELKDRGLITGYAWCFGLNDLILALGHKGPAVLGIPWHEGMYEAPKGILKVSGDQVGGHCILARGVSMTRKAILLRNSWGPSWGVRGDAWISFAEMEALLANDGEAVVPTRSTKALTA